MDSMYGILPSLHVSASHKPAPMSAAAKIKRVFYRVIVDVGTVIGGLLIT